MNGIKIQRNEYQLNQKRI